MKIINVKETYDIEKLKEIYSNYRNIDWQEDIESVLGQFDRELRQFNLEVEILSDGSDSYNFRVINMPLKKLTKRNEKVTNGTCFQDREINKSYSEMCKIFGKPSYFGSGDNKVKAEWVFYNYKGTITIYDYTDKNELENTTNWHIGGKGFTQYEIIDIVDEMVDNYRKLK